MEIKWDSETTLAVIIGAAIGLTVAYFLFRKKTSTQSVSNLNSLSTWKPLDNIPTIENPNSYIEIENKLQNTQNESNNNLSVNLTSYKNNEKKIVKRNSEGFIESVETIRDAKIT